MSSPAVAGPASGSASDGRAAGVIGPANDDDARAAADESRVLDEVTFRRPARRPSSTGTTTSASNVEGDGIDRDEVAGERFWRDAVDMAPEEGSEEAAWFLYQQYAARDNGSMATKFLDVAADLGHQDAEAKRSDSKN